MNQKESKITSVQACYENKINRVVKYNQHIGNCILHLQNIIDTKQYKMSAEVSDYIREIRKKLIIFNGKYFTYRAKHHNENWAAYLSYILRDITTHQLNKAIKEGKQLCESVKDN